MEWVETTGKTVDEAKELALDQLGVAADEAEFEVVESPRPGLFGRLRGEARAAPGCCRPTSARSVIAAAVAERAVTTSVVLALVATLRCPRRRRVDAVERRRGGPAAQRRSQRCGHRAFRVDVESRWASLVVARLRRSERQQPEREWAR
ncbi:MAG: Jag N-terminal domain-containing protein [Ilumatobacteraceae bacterium]